jgi:signal peptidase I
MKRRRSRKSNLTSQVTDTGFDEAVSGPTDEESREIRRRRRKRWAMEWVVIAIVAVGVSLPIRAFAFQTFYIPSGSMEPTLWPGDRIVVDKLSVEFGKINIGDIVVFHAPPGVKSHCSDAVAYLVKRVIGLPGDHLTSNGNTIFVNGRPLDQSWRVKPEVAPPIGNVTVPTGQYFMMGDYHSNSCDSRMWGTVPRADIIGKVFLKIWPPSSISWY